MRLANMALAAILCGGGPVVAQVPVPTLPEVEPPLEIGLHSEISCEGAKLRLSGKYARCLLGAEGTAGLGEQPDSTGCHEAFDRDWDRVIAEHPSCRDRDDQAEVQEVVLESVERIRNRVDRWKSIGTPKRIVNSETCAISELGRLRCRKLQEFDETGDPIFTVERPLGDTRLLSADGAHVKGCGVTFSGEIQCWGELAEAELPGSSFRSVVVNPTSSDDVCAIDRDGELSCNTFAPEILPEGPFRKVDLQGSRLVSGCGLRENGSVSCFGSENLELSGPFRDVAVNDGTWVGIRESDGSLDFAASGVPALPPGAPSTGYVRVDSGSGRNDFCWALGTENSGGFAVVHESGQAWQLFMKEGCYDTGFLVLPDDLNADAPHRMVLSPPNDNGLIVLPEDGRNVVFYKGSDPPTMFLTNDD